MSKVLFVTRKDNLNMTIHNKLKANLDCEFSGYDTKKILSLVTEKSIDVVVLYLTELSIDEDLEVNKFLLNSNTIPVILAGQRQELSRYYQKTSANIIRYIKTPILITDFIAEIKKTFVKETEEINVPAEIVEMAKPKHVLVVDDDIVMLRTINNWLKEVFKVSVAKSGMEAIKFLGKDKPDLILLDYNMPVCDGVQTLKMIRSDESLKDIPVFFLTGVDNQEQIKKALELKPEGYILKSNGADYLLSKIEAYL